MGTYSGKMGKGGSKVVRSERAAEAVDSAEKRAKLSNKQKLALLDQRFGAGVGAKKERKRLSAPPKTAPKAEEASVKEAPSSPKMSAGEKKAKQDEKRAARAAAKPFRQPSAQGAKQE